MKSCTDIAWGTADRSGVPETASKYTGIASLTDVYVARSQCLVSSVSPGGSAV
jgi:hypothetical protein